jgi:hypothetical protein
MVGPITIQVSRTVARDQGLESVARVQTVATVPVVQVVTSPIQGALEALEPVAEEVEVETSHGVVQLVMVEQVVTVT